MAINPVIGTKKSKNRITLLLCCNASGTEKFKPLLIHRYETPRCLNRIDKNKLPVEYYWNKTTWMQVSIWEDYLKKLNLRMRRQQRHILLLIDNAPTHTILEPSELTNIKIHPLPPNTTSHLQPCDAGIIRSFKVNTNILLLCHLN